MHPEQDINAKIKARQHHLTSRQEIISDMPGPSMDEIDQQIDEDPYDFQMLKKYKNVVFDAVVIKFSPQRLTDDLDV